MKTRACSFRLLIVAIALLIGQGSFVFADWSEAIQLTELGEAGVASLTEDQRLVLYFRDDQLFEAYRDDPLGQFTEERAVTELGSGLTSIRDTWLSQDGLRLYYAEIVSLYGKMQRVIKLATRASTSDLWTETAALLEIHTKGIIDTSPTLSADELTIMWYSQVDIGDPQLKTYIATRSNRDEPFGDVREVPELSARLAKDLHLSADGLRIYFSTGRDDTLIRNIYVGERATLDAPFENIQELEGICGPDLQAGGPWLTSDEKTIYFNSNRSGERAIYVSYWIEAPVDPYAAAVARLEEAIAGKREALGVVLATLEDDRAALAALNALREAGTVDPVNIVQAKVRVFQSIQQQISARRSLERSIADLEEALVRLQAEPRRNIAPGRGKNTDKPTGSKIIKAARGSR